MKRRFIAGLLLAGGLTMSAAASAAPWSWTGTLADWAAAGGTGTITDGDGDMQFTLSTVSTTIPDRDRAFITIEEVEIGGKDYYDVGIDWGPQGYAGGGQLVYKLTSLSSSGELISGATLDSAITGSGTTSLMILRDLPANAIFANLTSANGARDPLTGELLFAGRSVVGVQQIFQPTTTALYQDSHAGFVATVPEPGALSLALLALLPVVGTLRRRR